MAKRSLHFKDVPYSGAELADRFAAAEHASKKGPFGMVFRPLWKLEKRSEDHWRFWYNAGRYRSKHLYADLKLASAADGKISVQAQISQHSGMLIIFAVVLVATMLIAGIMSGQTERPALWVAAAGAIMAVIYVAQRISVRVVEKKITEIIGCRPSGQKASP